MRRGVREKMELCIQTAVRKKKIRLKKMTKRVLYISNLDDIINIYVANLGNFQLVVATDTGDRVSPKVAIVSPVDTELQLDFSLLTFPISPF